MNELTHSNRRQEAKEGRVGEGSRDQAQANASAYSWMRRKTSKWMKEEWTGKIG